MDTGFAAEILYKRQLWGSFFLFGAGPKINFEPFFERSPFYMTLQFLLFWQRNCSMKARKQKAIDG